MTPEFIDVCFLVIGPLSVLSDGTLGINGFGGILGAVLSQKQADGQYNLVAYASHSLTTHECIFHAMKQEFLTLKWAIAEQFQECHLWKPFIVRTEK